MYCSWKAINLSVWMKEICTILVKLYIICSRMQRVSLHASPPVVIRGVHWTMQRGVLQTWITHQSPAIVMLYMWPVLSFSCSHMQYIAWNLRCPWNEMQHLCMWPFLAFTCCNSYYTPWNLHCPWNKMQHLYSVTCPCFHMLQHRPPIKYACTLVVVCFCHCYIITSHFIYRNCFHRDLPSLE